MKAKSIVEAMKWRYATKAFDPSKKVDSEIINELIESVRLTATSYGMQLMKLVLVEDMALREELVAYSYGQKQVKDASHLFVLCRESVVDYDQINGYIHDIAKERELEAASLDGFKNMMANSILNMSDEDQINWLEKQVYIALGNLLTTCAILEVDSCPMEGFIAEKYDETLGLEGLGLNAVLVIPVGYRSDKDVYSKIKKVRRGTDRFLVKI